MRSLVTSLVILAALLPSTARAEDLTLGVYLPQAPFATNAERSAWAEKLALDLGQRAGLTVRAQVFGRREDAAAFAGRVDLLVADGLFAVTQSGEALAHASLGPAVALYALEARNVGELEGKVVGAAEVGAGEASFYSNSVLGGELVADRFFAEIRLFKDSQTALGAVKSRTVAAAFAPADHPAGGGLTVLASGGSYPVAVVIVANAAKVAPLSQKLSQALVGLPVGPLGSLVSGGGSALAQARQARGAPRVSTLPALVTGGVDQRPAAPPIRLRARGRLPGLDLQAAPLAPPRLADP
jgi:hypothetical protein